MTDRQQVIGELCKPFPRQAIKQNQGRDYVSGTTVIYRLNAATNPDWEFEITGHELVGGAESQGNKPAQVVYGRMRIPVISSGWRADMGTQALENSRDDHEAYKGAATDCLKRCARQFGVGLHLWGDDIEAGAPAQRQAPRQQAPPAQREMPQERGNIAAGVGMTDQQRKAIWAISKNERAMTEQDVEMMSKSMFGVELAALDKSQASQFIERLKQTGEPATHPKVQAAIDSREANWIAAMEGAATMGELSGIAAEIAQSENKSETLRAAYTKHRDRLQNKSLVS
jgi:hypothetical protein